MADMISRAMVMFGVKIIIYKKMEEVQKKKKNSFTEMKMQQTKIGITSNFIQKVLFCE